MAKAKTKKAGSKKAKTAKKTTLNPISAKQYGRNVVMIIEGEKYSRAFYEKEERDEILLTVESFNAKPTKKLQTSIISTMLEMEKKKEAKQKEREKAKKNLTSTEKVAKPEPVEVSKTEIEQAKELLQKDGYVVSKPAPRTRRGEY